MAYCIILVLDGLCFNDNIWLNLLRFTSEIVKERLRNVRKASEGQCSCHRSKSNKSLYFSEITPSFVEMEAVMEVHLVVLHIFLFNFYLLTVFYFFICFQFTLSYGLATKPNPWLHFDTSTHVRAWETVGHPSKIPRWPLELWPCSAGPPRAGNQRSATSPWPYIWHKSYPVVGRGGPASQSREPGRWNREKDYVV